MASSQVDLLRADWLFKKFSTKSTVLAAGVNPAHQEEAALPTYMAVKPADHPAVE